MLDKRKNQLNSNREKNTREKGKAKKINCQQVK